MPISPRGTESARDVHLTAQQVLDELRGSRQSRSAPYPRVATLSYAAVDVFGAVSVAPPFAGTLGRLFTGAFPGSLEHFVLVPHVDLGRYLASDGAVKLILASTVQTVTAQLPSSTLLLVSHGTGEQELYMRVHERNDPDWVRASDPALVATAVGMADELRRCVPLALPTELRSSAFPPEPLAISAPIARQLANALCVGDYVDPEGCEWYHAAWQFLRMTNKVSTPRWHGGFFTSALRAVTSQIPRPRILICGTADYSMLAFVAHALSASPAGLLECHIDVLDRCAAPLTLCNWYAARYDFRQSVSTVHAAIEDYDPGVLYDVIVTDAFLTRFPPEREPTASQVVDKWASLLADGGCIVTTIRVHGKDERSAATTADLHEAYVQEALSSLNLQRPFLPLPATDAAQLVADYCRYFESAAIGSEQDIVTMFEFSGMTNVLRRWARVPGEFFPSHYLQLVAAKRAEIAADAIWHGDERARSELYVLLGIPETPGAQARASTIRETIEVLVGRLRAQAEQTPPFGDNIATAVFAAQALADVGESDRAQTFIDWVRRRWSVTDRGPEPVDRPTAERIDFEEILERMPTSTLR